MLEELIKAAIQQYLQSDMFQKLVEASAQDSIVRFMELSGYRQIESQIEDIVKNVSISISVD